MKAGFTEGASFNCLRVYRSIECDKTYYRRYLLYPIATCNYLVLVRHPEQREGSPRNCLSTNDLTWQSQCGSTPNDGAESALVLPFFFFLPTGVVHIFFYLRADPKYTSVPLHDPIFSHTELSHRAYQPDHFLPQVYYIPKHCKGHHNPAIKRVSLPD
jgi:hypothetical protein